jgi:hypothetical protein
VPDLSPALELAVSLIAEGQTIPAHLCCDNPRDVADIERCSLGVGMVDGNGGMIEATRQGTVVCLAYDVRGQLVTSTTTGMPCPVQEGAQCRVGPMTNGIEP